MISAMGHLGGPATGPAEFDPPDWTAAQATQEAVIAAGGGGEASQGLAIALFWQNEVDDALRAMERAYTSFRRNGERGQAAWAALWLTGQYSRLTDNTPAASGWIARCERVIAQAQPSAEIGTVILVRALATNDRPRSRVLPSARWKSRAGSTSARAPQEASD